MIPLKPSGWDGMGIYYLVGKFGIFLETLKKKDLGAGFLIDESH